MKAVQPIAKAKPAGLEGKVSSQQSPSRQGKKVIAGFFPPEVRKQFHQIALDQEATTQALLTEALNLLFEKHGKPPIA